VEKFFPILIIIEFFIAGVICEFSGKPVLGMIYILSALLNITFMYVKG
jgi:hypothetical protein